MINRLFMIFVLFFSFSCNVKENKNVIMYKLYIYEHDEVTINTEKIKFSKIISGNSYNLKYQSLDKKNSYEYFFVDDTTKHQQKRVNPEGDVDNLLLEDFKIVSINENKYKVYKFSTNSGAIDKTTFIYWSPDLGIVLFKSKTWRSFKKLLSDNPDINSLSKVIIGDKVLWGNSSQYFDKSNDTELDSLINIDYH